jgi:hypothetical protein
MALTRNGLRIGRAAQMDNADRWNEAVDFALNPSDAEHERMNHEMDAEKEQKINEAICACLAPDRYAKIREFQQIRKAYRRALQKLVDELQAEDAANERERNDLYRMGMGA